MFSLGLCLFPSPTILLPVLVIHKWGKKCITADQMGTFHMTKPINHLGGTQVWHSRAATHHFTVYQAQTHGHQSMAPWGPVRRGRFYAASLVHGWWLHNHTSILSEEKGDELPNNVSHHVNTNTVMDAALVGRLNVVSPPHHTFTCELTTTTRWLERWLGGGGGVRGWREHI